MEVLVKQWPIYVLSLPGSDARRALLIETLTKMRLDYEIVFGIDGREGLPSQWYEHVDRTTASRAQGRDLTDGELACALSHREIYRKIVSERLLGAVILEDDAVIGSRFVEFFTQQKYCKAPLMMLDHSHARVSGHASELMPGILMRRLALPSCLTTAYSISTDAALNLLNAASPVITPADWPGDIVALGAVVLDPRIADHPDPLSGNSNLEADRKAKPQHKGSLLRAFSRWTNTAHWRRWLIKRRSTRIS